MKKLAAKRRKPPKRKRGAKVSASPFAGVDVKRLRQFLTDDLGEEESSLEDMVYELLAVDSSDPESLPDEEAVTEFEEALMQARIDANGGDPGARKTLKSIRAAIDEAAQGDEIDPAALVVLGRLFAGAQIDVGAAARASAARLFDLGPLPVVEDGLFNLLVEPLLSSGIDDPFLLHDEIRASITILPVGIRAALVEALCANTDRLARQSAVGFLLDPDETVVLAAIRALAAASERGNFDQDCRRWIGMIRAWLPPALQAATDAAIPPGAPVAPRIGPGAVRARASVCDGSGAAGVYAVVRRGSRHAIASVMTQPSGVADATLIEDVSKDEAKAFELESGSWVPSAEISLATLRKLVELGLGRNLASATLPPFALVRFLDAIGLEALVADAATPGDLIETMLAGFPRRDHEALVREAHEWAASDDEVTGDWFEAGDDVDAVLDTADSVREGAQALLDAYLPGRRVFWAGQCALSALALMDEQRLDRDWKKLALVGRDILHIPFKAIPLMTEIAERSAAAYFTQRGGPFAPRLRGGERRA